MSSSTSHFIEGIENILGKKNVLLDQEKLHHHLVERRGRFNSETLCVALPSCVEELSELVRFCQTHSLPIVPQGGNTGVCGGAVSKLDSVIVNTKRMNRIRNIDPSGYTIEAEAGVILADLQVAANECGRYFPLSLGAQGSCHIGGNLATNAGGVNVLRYGNARDLVLGIEAVLANGEIWNGLNTLRKNNTGYDLKNLFIGAEGTLGIISAAVFKLFPAPIHQSTALIAVESIKKAVELFSKTRQETSDFASSFELMSRYCIDSALRNIPECKDFFEQPYPWYVLLELGDSTSDGFCQQLNERFLEQAFTDELILDAVLAASSTQAQQMWRLREAIVETQLYEGASIKSDVSVPLLAIEPFIETAQNKVQSMIPGVRCFVYGHVGDGNIHFNMSQPEDTNSEAFFEKWWEVTDAIHSITDELNGSFSAEHGIGLLKTRDMARYKPPVEIKLMQSIKSALDPNNILNPGKVLPPVE